MEIKVLKRDKEKISFILKNVNAAIANTIRRIIVDEVPTLAIEDVTFIKNSSALYDEIIAHRIGLIPIKTDLKTYNLQADCKCKGKGCAMCKSYFKLKAAPGPCTVYASDLKGKDAKAKPIYPKMPIVKLLKGQELEIEAVAVLGEGKDHAKFSPGLTFYRAYPMIKIEKCNNCGKCVEACPQKILKIENKKLKVTDIEKCDLCKACEDICEPNSIKVSGSKEEFIFYLESFGQLEPKKMISTAFDIFNKKLNEFDKLVNKMK